MRQSIILTILTISIIMSGCKSKKVIEDLPMRTIISGKIENLDIYPDTKEIFAEVLDFRDRKTVFKDSINENGSFLIEITLYTAQDIKILPILDKIILHPGDSMFVNLDFGDLSFANFSGDRSKENKALHVYNWHYCDPSFYTKDKLSIAAYKNYCDNRKAEAFLSRKKFITKCKPPKEVKIWTENHIRIKYLNAILSYPNIYFKWYDKDAYLQWIESNNFLEQVEDELSAYGQGIINADIYKLIERYSSVFSRLSKRNLQENKRYSVDSILNNIISKHSNEAFKQLVLGQYFYRVLISNYTNVVDCYKDIFNNQIQIPFIREPLNHLYQVKKQHLENPQIVSGKILSKMGANGKTIMDSIISQNAEKVLFVDLWATWCGPCLNGMAKAKEIMPRFKNKDIEFIFLCVNSTEQNWMSILSEYRMGGKHYYCNNDQSKDIRRAFKVETIPHYLIINKAGHIVREDCNDLEKSQGILNELLNEK